MEFKLWIIENQLSRRNLQEIDRIELSEEFRETFAELATERQREAGEHYGEGHPKELHHICGEALEESDPHARQTDAKVAEKAQTSREKVRKVRKIRELVPELIDKVRCGEESINSARKFNPVMKFCSSVGVKKFRKFPANCGKNS